MKTLILVVGFIVLWAVPSWGGHQEAGFPDSDLCNEAVVAFVHPLMPLDVDDVAAFPGHIAIGLTKNGVPIARAIHTFIDGSLGKLVYFETAAGTVLCDARRDAPDKV